MNKYWGGYDSSDSETGCPIRLGLLLVVISEYIEVYYTSTFLNHFVYTTFL